MFCEKESQHTIELGGPRSPVNHDALENRPPNSGAFQGHTPGISRKSKVRGFELGGLSIQAFGEQPYEFEKKLGIRKDTPVDLSVLDKKGPV